MVKKLPIVEVKWLDAHGGSYQEWHDTTELQQKPEIIHTVGFLWKDNEVGVTVLLSHYGGRKGHFDAYIFVPTECILEMNILESEDDGVS